MHMRICLFAILITLFSIPLAADAEEMMVSIYYIDVGQGDATLLHQPGKCTMLVDAGPPEAGHVVNKILRMVGIETLDYVVITHPHKDHFGGLRAVASAVGISELSDNGDMNPGEKGFDEYSQLQDSLPYSVLSQGDSWQCGDLTVEVLHPSAGYSSGDGDYNNRSMALSVRYNSFGLLLMGDVAGQGEKEMLRTSSIPQSSVIQLAHHGASDGTSMELLDRVRPRLAVVSVGRTNDIQAPAPVVLGRLAERNIRTFRTDLEGTVHMKVAPNGNIRIKP